jgi:hypothetical protein
MAWVSAGEYAITDGRHWIAKLLVHGTAGYLLWLDGRLVHQCFSTSAQAKNWAQEHETQYSTPGCD